MSALRLVLSFAFLKSIDAASCNLNFTDSGAAVTWSVQDIDAPCCLALKKSSGQYAPCLNGHTLTATSSVGGVACTGSEECIVENVDTKPHMKTTTMSYYGLPTEWCKFLQQRTPPMPASTPPSRYCVATTSTFTASLAALKPAVATPELCEEGLCEVAGCTCWSTCNVLPVARSCGNPPEGFKYSKTQETGNADGCSTTSKSNVRDQCELLAITPDEKCTTHPGCLGLDGDCCPLSNGTNLGCCNTEDKFCENGLCQDAGCTCWSTCGVLSRYRTCCYPSDEECVNAPKGFKWIKTGMGTIGTGCSSVYNNLREACELVADTPTAACNTHAGCLGIKGDCCPNAAGTTLPCCDGAEETEVVM